MKKNIKSTSVQMPLPSTFSLQKKQEGQLLPNGTYPIFKDRMSWVKSYLKMAGLVKNKNL
jgi:restriction endonuclease Mrr